MYAWYVYLLQLFCTYYVGVWRECSVRGGIYSLRETRSIPSKSQKVDAECNILQDGTLIDLCGATLVWRSRTGQYFPVAAVPSPPPTPLIGHSHPKNLKLEFPEILSQKAVTHYTQNCKDSSQKYVVKIVAHI